MGWLAHFNGTQPIYNQVSLGALRSNRQVSSARAARDLGYQPRPFETTITDTFNWFVQNGYLAMSP
jgi:nucleoside-diphosphate-sugar epimerase